MTNIHASDCAMHNAPAYEAGPCDCGAAMTTHPHADLIARLNIGCREIVVGGEGDWLTTDFTYCSLADVREAIAALSAPLTLAQAMQCPEVQAMVKPIGSFDRLIAEARVEAAKAMRKFPQPNYVISKVAEEAGEVVKAAIHYAENRETPENVAGEMKQLIAMLYRLWIEGDEVHGMKPICAFARGQKEGATDAD